MGRGPEQRPDLRRFARTALLGTAGAGAAIMGVSVVDQHLNTLPAQNAIYKSVPYTTVEDKEAYGEKASRISKQTGLEEQSRKDMIVLYAGMFLFSIPASILLELATRRAPKNHSTPQTQTA